MCLVGLLRAELHETPNFLPEPAVGSEDERTPAWFPAFNDPGDVGS